MNARTESSIAGFVFHKAATKLLDDILIDELGLPSTSPLRRAATVAMDAISVEETSTKGSMVNLVNSSDLIVLLGMVVASVNSESLVC